MTSKVQVPDAAVHSLKSAYLDHNGASGLFAFPPLRDAYYDGDSWIEPIRHDALPDPVHLRHRLWSSEKDDIGYVDLIVSPATDAEAARLVRLAEHPLFVQTFSKGKGARLSDPIPAMRAATGFDPAIYAMAIRRMERLVKLWTAPAL